MTNPGGGDSYHFGLRLSTFIRGDGDPDESMGFEWSLVIQDSASFEVIKRVANVEIRPSLGDSSEYEVFFEEEGGHTEILGRHCTKSEANSRAANAIEKFKRSGKI